MNSSWKPINDQKGGLKKGELAFIGSGKGRNTFRFSKSELEDSMFTGYEDMFKKVLNTRLQIIEGIMCNYLESVQCWNMSRIKRYLSNTKNVRIKGAEHLKKIRRQGSNKEHWYFNDECIFVTDKHSWEVLQIGDWYND